MIHFVLWEAMKVLALTLLALLAVKVVASLRPAGGEAGLRQLRLIKLGLYAVILGLVLWGAWITGYDVAAEVYYWADQDNLQHNDYPKAFVNALSAVRLRPGVLRYWRALVASKMYVGQFASALEDRPALQSLSGGSLDEGDAYQFALCSYLSGQYPDVVQATQELIRQSPYYVASYVLQGLAYTAQRRFPEAEQSYLDALRLFPNNQVAIEGLAHAYFLAGDRERALAILTETATRPFSPEARKSFEALKSLYAQ